MYRVVRSLFALCVVGAGIVVVMAAIGGLGQALEGVIREVLPKMAGYALVGLVAVVAGFLGTALALQGVDWAWSWSRDKLLSFRVLGALNGRSGRIDRFTRYSLLSWGKRVAVAIGEGITRIFRVLSDRYREEHELVRLEIEERLAAAHAESERIARERLELERVRGIENVPVLLQARVLTERLKETKLDRFQGGDGENVMFKLYVLLQERLEKVSTVPLRTREEHAQGTVRLNAIEAILMGYDERIRRIEESDLPEHQKAADVEFLVRLREGDIGRLGAA